ncbi:metal-dependent phosphohydrolase [Phycicoccus sp. BSK3Z-2]|uniref:Metal-dependent phosphohydrolase n=1 Tax=Phycicoccus avicenniae TaxID=2828860 RepID=A0A941HYL4_9MICO|nr:hypothetical protein [Phycicoccus avicenniae]MBR7741980.1 metal-dependent phosphohydrolase [Phycicoccus avicenniae]
MQPMTQRWLADTRAAVAGLDRAAAATAGEALLDRWSEPHRHYHGTTHLGEVLAAVDGLHRSLRVAADERPVAVLAAWFHDAVYRVDEPEWNEKDSAALAVEVLTDLGAAPLLVDRVGQAVLDTREHDVGPDAELSRVVLHDADLWVLSAPTGRFDEYCAQVRAEYRHVPTADYASARAAVLRPFLAREHVYASAPARSGWEPLARENLAREISRLGA